MDSVPAAPRIYDFAYRRRNKKFFDRPTDHNDVQLDSHDDSSTPSQSGLDTDSMSQKTSTINDVDFKLQTDVVTAAVVDESSSSTDHRTRLDDDDSTSKVEKDIVVSNSTVLSNKGHLQLDENVDDKFIDLPLSQKPSMLQMIDEVSSRWQRRSSNIKDNNSRKVEINRKLNNSTIDLFTNISDQEYADASDRDSSSSYSSSSSFCSGLSSGRKKKRKQYEQDDPDYKQQDGYSSHSSYEKEENPVQQLATVKSMKRHSSSHGLIGCSDNDEYTISSANSSDSEHKEMINKIRMKERRFLARERRQKENEQLKNDLHWAIRTRKDKEKFSIDSSTNPCLILNAKSSFEALKNTRRQRQLKHSPHQPSTSAENKIKRPKIDNDDLASEKEINNQNEDESLDKNKKNFSNRKRMVVHSDSSDEDDIKLQFGCSALLDEKKRDDDLDSTVSAIYSDESWSTTDREKPTGGKNRIFLASSDDDHDHDEEKNRESISSNLDAVKTKESETINEISFHDSFERNEKPKKYSFKEYQQQTLNFFNSASHQEMSSVPRCSERIAEYFVENRPYDSYQDLIGTPKIAKLKGFTVTLFENYCQILKCRNDLDHLLYSCKKISDDLFKSVEHLLKNDTCDSKMVLQPKLLTADMNLKPYQLIGLNWLILMHSKNLSCILADEMGLGKTIQVIAFLAYLKQIGVKGPHLIVVPSSTLDNWLIELKRWCPSLQVLTYYGALDDRKFLRCEILDGRMSNLDILLSTYRVVTNSSDDRAFLKRLKINYAIFDEAHMLKNCTTNRYRSLMRIRTTHRLLLTGTPLQNNLIEFISLMHFVLPDLFYDHTDNLKDLLMLFQSKTKSIVEYEQEKIEQAKSIMRPFVLRRLKREVLDQLPKKHEKIEFCELIGDQLDAYGAVVNECSSALKNLKKTNDLQTLNGNNNNNNQIKENDHQNQKPSPVFTNNDARCLLMQLRKAANHPLLLRRIFDDQKLKKIVSLLCKSKSHKEVDPERIFDDLSVMNDFELHRYCRQHKTLSRFKLSQNVINASAKFAKLDLLLSKAKAEDCKVLLFSQFTMILDIMEEYLKGRKHKFLRLDGSTPVVERQSLIDQFNSCDDLSVFLLSTKAGGLGINLTSANIIILHDIDYNPYNDRQAEDRCHRMGQTKEVQVIRLIAKNTIDEFMLACAKRKLELEQQVTNDDDNGSIDVESLLRQALTV